MIMIGNYKKRHEPTHNWPIMYIAIVVTPNDINGGSYPAVDMGY